MAVTDPQPKAKDKAAALAFVDLLTAQTCVGVDGEDNEFYGPYLNPTVQAHLAAALGEAMPVSAYQCTAVQKVMDRDNNSFVESPRWPGKGAALASYLRSVADHLDPEGDWVSATIADLEAEREMTIAEGGEPSSRLMDALSRLQEILR